MNWRFQIFHQKSHWIAEIYVLLQCWGPKELERNVSWRNQGIDQDVHEGSILGFSFHPAGMCWVHTLGIRRHVCTIVWSLENAHLTRFHLELCRIPCFEVCWKPMQHNQSPAANISSWHVGANVLRREACWCMPNCATDLIFLSAIPFWCFAPMPLNEYFWCCLMQCSLYSVEEKIPMSKWYSLTLNPSSIANASNRSVFLIVSKALVDYWGKLKILPLAWSTNKLPHV